MSALLAAMNAIETRLRGISVANGYLTDLGRHLKPSGVWLEEDDAPCMVVYEARANEDGLMRIDADGTTACGQEFDVPYFVEALLPLNDRQPPLEIAEHAAQDIMRALMGPDHGALPGVARTHRLTARGRGVSAKGSRVVPVQVHGHLKITEDIYR